MQERPQGESEARLFSLVTQRYLLWSEAESGFSPETIEKRRECLKQIVRVCGEKEVTEFNKEDLLVLKREMLRRRLSASRQCHILYALRSLLSYARDQERLAVFPPEDISFP